LKNCENGSHSDRRPELGRAKMVLAKEGQ
jgi:hypothetical protein